MNISADYVTGFCESGAGFTYCTTNKRITPCFAVRQQRDGGAVLYALREFFGVGSVYECKARLPSRESTYYKVFRKADFQSVVNHFESHPLKGMGKQAVFVKWCALVAEYAKAKPDQAVLRQTAQELSQLQLRPRSRKPA